MHPDFKEWMPQSPGTSVGCNIKALLSVWDPGMLLSGVIFLFLFLPQVHLLPFQKAYFPLWCLFLFWITHSFTKTHPSFEPFRTQALGSIAGAAGMALSSMGDKECFSMACYYFFVVIPQLTQLTNPHTLTH